ncbi:sigma-54-dependent Fis family transcriptional regulator [Desulfuromonas versatilis]|uniref:Sigma-54-dependent Fis family transcriptional regulator n=1 Tax=Desulfuromonas versatilis TaxID=2802975 RepID=A0ABM8HWY9_9BACT|nr:sigma-54 dependent transcriptional regulator [Desulfuromonas versatilis]BCR05294.1 sigma-54-dependent Fis family transcriptional regulator [Desulfuromonas versatilis]
MSPSQASSVLIVDDEPNAVRVLSAILNEEGYRVFEARHVDEAVDTLDSHEVDAVITDMKMPGRSGIDLFDHVAEHFPDVPVIFLTAFGTVESAVSAMTRGAFYYFVKPPDFLNLKGILARAVEQRQLKRELHALKQQLAGQDNQPQLVGKTLGIQKVLEVVKAIRDSESSVLVYGETGTGKELVARALHFGSARRNKPFVAVNCAAIPQELIESELFGYEKGAFTGASAQRIGRVEQASGGTLFLDEIGELDISVQAKLLRVLQEKEIERLGGNQRVSVNFRLVSSTNRDLLKEIAAGRFREDLYYRLNVVRIDMPALRERKSDIPLVVSEFLKEFCARENKVLGLSPKVMDIFRNYDWPGNIRQLRNVIERAVALAPGRDITEQELPEEIFQRPYPETERRRAEGKTLKEMEAHAIRQALEECAGNKSKVAQMLGFSRKALYKRLKDYGIS